MSTVLQERIKLDQEAIIELVTIDHPTAGVFRLTTGNINPNDTITFDGNTYAARGFSISEVSVQGKKMPRPTLTVDNTDGFWYIVVSTNNELLGATVTYQTVYRENLADGNDPDGTQIIDNFVFEVKQMQQIDASRLQLHLFTSIDTEKAKFGRQVLRRVCARSYRVPIEGVADTFTQRRCPYAGSAYFERDGTATGDWTLDACNKDVAACTLRFGEDTNLPIQAFPSVGQREV